MSGPGEGKSVSELKRWLTRFGEKNQEHFELNQLGTRRARSIQRRIEKFENQATTTTTTHIAPAPSFEADKKEAGSSGAIHGAIDSFDAEVLSSTKEVLVEQRPKPATKEKSEQALLIARLSFDNHDVGTLSPVEMFPPVVQESIEKTYSNTSTESHVEVDEQEGAIETTITKPVFRDFSNFLFKPAFLHCASSDDTGCDEPHLRSFKSSEEDNKPFPVTDIKPFPVEPRSWDEIDDFPSPSWDDEAQDAAPKWHPNAMPQDVLGIDELVDDFDCDGFAESSSVGVRRNTTANYGPFKKFTNNAKTLVGRRHFGSKPVSAEEVGKIAAPNQPVAFGFHRRSAPPLSSVSTSTQPIATSQDSKYFSETTMYNATICAPNMLTSSSLDYLCNGTYTPEADVTAASPCSLEHDSNTVSTWSEDSASPSILPNALDYGMSRMFVAESTTVGAAAKDQYGQYDYHVRRKELPPPILEVSTLEEADDASIRACHSQDDSSCPRFAGGNMEEVTAVEPMEDSFASLQATDMLSTCTLSLTGTSDINTPAVAKLVSVLSADSATKSSSSVVECRKQELEQQWAADKEPIHIKKVQWALDRKSGGYKKKVVLM